MAQYAARTTTVTSRAVRGPAPHLALYRPAPRRPRPDAAVYRRRRLLAAGLFLVAIAAALVLAQLIQAGIGGGPLTTTGAPAAQAGGPAMIPAGTRFYVVRPGDTIWSVADRLDPNGDERPLVDVLQRELKGSTLYPGEQIPLPSRW
jgi:hypothetical protein